MLDRWRREYREREKNAFPGTGHRTAEAEELKHFREENRRIRLEKETLKSGSILCQRVRVRYVLVYRHRYEFPLRLSCCLLETSPSDYYGFFRRRGDNIRQADLIARIREVHRRSRYTYGSRRIMHQSQTKNSP